MINFTTKILSLAVWALVGGTASLMAQEPYFQQDVDYEIRVRLDDQQHYLRGFETFVYRNNSPRPLDSMFLHLWPNAYRDQSSAFAQQQKEDGSLRFMRAEFEERGFIDSLSLKMDGKSVDWQPWSGNPDIALLRLPKPIPPGGTATFTTPFRVKIPASFSRLGHVGQQYQLCQWYPKPAVYDRTGWHPMPYLSQGEFYSEFGTFDVYIEVPKKYVVGATGDLAPNDPEWAWLRAREAESRKLLASDSLGFFKTAPDGNEYKTLHFHQARVHDFAWFCDANYYVLADTVKLPQSGREVRCVAMFTNLDRKLWKECPRYIKQAVYYYSLWNGDYPYNHATAVDGALSAGAGMEYPNITVLGAGGSAENLELVTMHEVGHNWYYGILGSNERSYPWMDEGLNTYFEMRYWATMHGDSMSMLPQAAQKALGIDFTHTFMARVSYQVVAGAGTDQPVQLHAADYTPLNYGMIAYMKSGLAFQYLESYLGRETIDKCFHAYYEAWKFKHPTPDDIQKIFEEVSGQDLDWFFDVYLMGVEKLDFRIKSIKGNELTITNRADIPLPAAVALQDKEGRTLRTIWTAPFVGDTTIVLPTTEYHAARLNAEGTIPELREENNTMRRKGLFRHSKPLALEFGYKFPDPSKANLYFLPTVGYNTTDGFMGGLLLYSGFFPKRRHEFHLMPMFGFKSSRIVGSGGLTLRWVPSKLFEKIEFHSRLSSFSTILRFKNYLRFDFRAAEMRSPWRHSLFLNSHIVANRPVEGEPALTPDDWYLPVYGSAVWETRANGPLGDFNSRMELGGNVAQRMARVSAEGRYTRIFLRKWRAGLRAFGGAILSPDAQPQLFQWGASGSRDPFGEQILLDRAGLSPFFSRQLQRDHGGISSRTSTRYDKFLFAVNADVKLPFKLVSVFADYAYGSHSAGISEGIYDAGIRFNFFSEVLHVNVPLVGTTFGGTPNDFDALLQGINFSFDPMQLIKIVGDAVPGID